MKWKDVRPYVACVDVGTNTVYSIIACEDENKQVHIVSTGAADSKGIKNGIVVDIDDSVSAIIRSVEEAEDSAGAEVKRVFLGINGSHVVGLNNSGVTRLARSQKEITVKDVKLAIQSASNVPLPDNREIIHTVLRGFTVDGMEGVKNPLGMLADVIEARVHIVSVALNPIQNLIKAVAKAQLEVQDLVFGGLAASHIVTSPEERELGNIVINIGAGTTSLMAYSGGYLCYSEVLPVGGDDLTAKISGQFRLVRDIAEDTKRKFAAVNLEAIHESETLSINESPRGMPVVFNKLEFCRLVKEWSEELLSEIRLRLEKNNLKERYETGVVLTGGGVLVRGFKELAGQTFGSHVRIGTGHNIVGLDTIVRNPCYATIIGLAKYALDGYSHRGDFLFQKKSRMDQMQQNLTGWFKDLF